MVILILANEMIMNVYGGVKSLMVKMDHAYLRITISDSEQSFHMTIQDPLIDLHMLVYDHV